MAGSIDNNSDGSDNQDTPEQLDLFGMSDEDIMNMESPPEATSIEPDPNDKELEKKSEDTDETESDDDLVEQENEDDSDEDDQEDSIDDDPDSDNDEESGDDASESEETGDDKESDEGNKDDEPNSGIKPDSKELADKAANYEKITKPFKASGKTMQISSPDEAIALMQRGADYSEKMRAMKPYLTKLKVLERAGIDKEETLNFLIDIHNGDQKAISKLIQEKGIDPIEMDLDTGKDYKPTDHSNAPGVNEEVALEQVINNIKDTPTYSKTIEIVGSKWDAESKNILSNAPDVIEVINDHVASGAYDVIHSEVTRQRAFGNLDNVNDVMAYKLVGDAMANRGELKEYFPDEEKTPIDKPADKVISPTKKEDDAKLNKRRKAASSSKATAKQKQNSNKFNPLSMSDDEFEKLSQQHGF